MKKWIMYAVTLVVSISLITACGAGKAVTPNAGEGGSYTVSKEPVELTFYLYSLSPKDFDQYYVQPLKAKFPNMTIKSNQDTISKLMTADMIPDVVIGSKKAIEDTMKRFELDGDISDLIKKHNYDLGKLNPALIDSMKAYADGQIIGLPLNETRNVLYYNKDLFDKFGVAYPKDGMTWDEIYEIAKKMTRTEDGVQYRGYSERYHDMLYFQNPFGYPAVDPQEEKASVNNDQWKKITENMLRFYTLPGLTFTKQSAASEQDKLVFPKGLSAMQMFPQSTSEWQFNWDLVSMPSYKEAPGVGTPTAAIYNFIAKQGKHKDAAFDAIAYLTSDERQLAATKDGAVPALKMNDTLKKAFLENSPLFKGKNIDAYFKYKYGAEMPARAAGLVQNFQLKAIASLESQITDVISGAKDLNTALRTADENINKALVAEKSK